MSELRSVASKLPEWKNVLRSLHNRLVEFPSQPFTPPAAYSDVRTTWLECFAQYNEERTDGVSLTDLFYVTQCYLRVLQRKLKKPKLEDLVALMAELRLLCCNNTTVTRNYEPDTPTLDRIRDGTAAFVVWHFGAGRDKITASLPSDCQHLIPTELAKRIADARCLDFQAPAREAVQEGTLVSPDSDDSQQNGFFWSRSRDAVVRAFVSFASRLTHSLEYDDHLLQKLQARAEPSLSTEIASPARRHKMQAWMTKQAQVEQSGEFMLDLRKLVFEESLPRNCLYTINSRRSARVNKSTSVDSLLQDECGFLALNRLASTTSQPLPRIAEDQAHEVHFYLLLLFFHYRFMHSSKKKFLHQFWVTRQRLCNSDALQEFFTKVRWGMNQRPVVVQLKKRLFVLDVSGPDEFDRAAEEQAKRIEYVECVDMYEALLYWIHLMRTKYKNELICATSVRAVYEPFV